MKTKELVGVIGQYGLAYYFFGWRGVLIWLFVNFTIYGMIK